MKKTLLCLALPLLAGGLLLTPAQSQKEQPPSIEKLIQQLDSSSFRVRERAEQQLRERGPAVLPALRKAQKQAPLELHLRLERLIEHLEIVAALQPRRVTLTGKAQPLSAVLKEIERQTGYKIAADDKVGEQVVSLKMKDVPYWEAVAAIERKTELVVEAPYLLTDSLDVHLRLKREGRRFPFATVKGAFRLAAWRFHEDRDIDFSLSGAAKYQGQHEHKLTLTVSVLAEPKLIILAAKPARVELAMDENGKSFGTLHLKEAKTNDELFGWFRRDFHDMSKVFLRRPNETSKTLRTLRGVMPVHVVIERKPVVVTKNFGKSKGMMFKMDDETLKIERADIYKDKVYVEIAVPPPQDDLNLRWLQRVHLEDAAGNRFPIYSSGHSQSGNKYSITLGFDMSANPAFGPPTHLIVEDWRIVEHAIPFEFRDVPLP